MADNLYTNYYHAAAPNLQHQPPAAHPHHHSHNHHHHHHHHHHPQPQPQLPPPPHARASRAVFALLAQPFVGSSRPPSSSGPGSGGGGTGTGGGRGDSSLSAADAPTSAPNQLNPRTVKYDFKAPILALSANVECDRVVLAGRDILRVLRVGYNEVSEVAVLRVPGEQKRYFQCDVKWGTAYQKDTIATAETNGTICVYDMKDGVLDRQLREHGRQAHKVAFNPADGRLLLSASQDGTIKLWDLRERKSRYTFVGRADAVRDVQFNPVNVMEFAAAFDNGTIQRWDYRGSVYERKINAHNGPAFAVDWHPDGAHCASAGRDKTVKVWDFYADPRQKARHTISTMASVSRIAWRPLKQGTTELATCAINNDHRVHVWDVKRPHIPTLIMDEHENSTTGILWKDEDVLWSCSKDSKFVQNDVVFASQPINSLTHCAFSWGPTDNFTFAAQQRNTRRNASRGFDSEDDLAAGHDRRRYGRSSSFRAQNLPTGGLETLDSKVVHSQATASVSMPGLFDGGAFEYLAEGYVFDLEGQMGGPKLSLGMACEKNAKAAWRAQKYRTAQTWKMLQLAISREDKAIEKERLAKAGDVASTGIGIGNHRIAQAPPGLNIQQSNPSAGATPLARPVADFEKNGTTPMSGGGPGAVDEALLLPPAVFATSLGSSTTSTDGEEYGNARVGDADGNAINGHDVKARPTLSIATVAPGVETQPVVVSDMNGNGEGRSMDSLALFSASIDQFPRNVLGVGPMDVQHPNPDNRSQHHPQNSSEPTTMNSSGSYSNSAGRRNRESLFSVVSEATSSSYGTGVGGFGGRASEEEDDEPGASSTRAGAWAMEAIQEEDPTLVTGLLKQSVPELRVPKIGGEGDDVQSEEEREAKPWNPQKIIEKVVEWYCDRGDVQMCATLVLLLADRMEIDKRRGEEWVEGYIQLLRRFKLFTAAAGIIKTTRIDGLVAAGQTNTFADVACGHCYKPIFNTLATRSGQPRVPGTWFCDRCQRLQDGCVICRETVKGRWTMCQTCSHGGHDGCLREWFFDEMMDACPAVGCGHDCLPR